MVEWKKLGDVCEVLDSQRRPVSKGNRRDGIYPYYGANGIQDYVENYLFDGTFLLLGEDGSVINKDKSPVLHWAIGKIWVNNHAHILKGIDNYSLRYIYYALQCVDVSDIVRGVPPKINQANMRNILIPVPSISEQNRIVGILDTFTDSIENLKEQISQRRKQYEHYRDQLLDLEGKEGVEMKTLGDICEIGDGIHGTPTYNESGSYYFINGNNLSNGFIIIKKDTKKVDESMYERYGMEFKSNTIFMSINGTIGNIALFNGEKILLGKSAAYFMVKDNSILYYRYLYHLLQTTKSNDYYNEKLTGSTIKNLGLKSLRNFIIPVPLISEQQHIVSILDTFEASISNLEAQLAQRQKQYEYYRNQLLTFE